MSDTEEEKYWNVVLSKYQRNRFASNNIPQKSFLMDKLAFHIFCDRFGIRCPDLLGVYYQGQYCDCDLNPQVGVDIKQMSGYFIKYIAGSLGTTVYYIENYNDLTSIPRLKRYTWVLEKKVVQHPTMASLNPNSINTLRVVTVRNGTSIDIFECWLKASIGDSHTDNVHSGGVCILVGEDGRLQGEARQLLTGKAFSKHPLSGVKFSEFTVPFWDAVKDLVVNAHRHLYNVHSVGWDVAITPYGPLLIEGNSKWDMRIVPQLLGEAPLEKYEKYFGKKK